MSEQSAPVVETSYGKIHGTIIEGVAAFKAVPYGLPPDGELRFLPPRAPKSSADVLDTTSYTGRAAKLAGPVWMYSFDWETPVHDGKMKAPHAMDVPLMFGTIDLTNATNGGTTARRLAETMSGVRAAFARGIPDHPSIPHWPACSS